MYTRIHSLHTYADSHIDPSRYQFRPCRASPQAWAKTRPSHLHLATQRPATPHARPCAQPAHAPPSPTFFRQELRRRPSPQRRVPQRIAHRGRTARIAVLRLRTRLAIHRRHQRARARPNPGRNASATAYAAAMDTSTQRGPRTPTDASVCTANPCSSTWTTSARVREVSARTELDENTKIWRIFMHFRPHAEKVASPAPTSRPHAFSFRTYTWLYAPHTYANLQDKRSRTQIEQFGAFSVVCTEILDSRAEFASECLAIWYVHSSALSTHVC